MKLELKHLAPYLPYKLNFLNIADNEILQLNALYDNGDAFNWDSGEVDFDLIKPLLRPLSDLTKENLPDFLRENEFYLYESFIVSIVRNKGINLASPYGLVQVLISHHFDIFGLIEKGLAIDLNTIEQ